jgi:hypothetical protein
MKQWLIGVLPANSPNMRYFSWNIAEFMDDRKSHGLARGSSDAVDVPLLS